MTVAKEKEATTPDPIDPDVKDAARVEFKRLHEAFGLSQTPASDDPKETRKKGEPLTPGESKRLHELHAILA